MEHSLNLLQAPIPLVYTIGPTLYALIRLIVRANWDEQKVYDGFSVPIPGCPASATRMGASVVSALLVSFFAICIAGF